MSDGNFEKPESVRISDTATAIWIPANNNPRRQFIMAARVHLGRMWNQKGI
jgi:hypothetical protein